MIWWLSFATEEGPLGICFADGETAEEAITNATARGCNPLGRPAKTDEIMATPMPTDADPEVQHWGMYRLVTPDELRSEGYITTGEAQDVGYDIGGMLDAAATVFSGDPTD